jgi:hypothetical protein
VADSCKNFYVETMATETLDPREIARRGTGIYERKYRGDYERKWRGRFVAIDIDTESAYMGKFPEEALANAKSNAPQGIFFLLRVGSEGAFKASRLGHADNRGL